MPSIVAGVAALPDQTHGSRSPGRLMTPSHAILDGLTEAQRQAVSHVEGPLLVVAGAGSGKTRVITRRVAYLASQGIRSHRILAVTFTNKAAGEMRERIEQLVGARGPWVSTFHSLCARMLRFSADLAGLPANFSIYDRSDQLNVVREALKSIEAATESLRPAAALSRISNAKNHMRSPADLAAEAAGFTDELAARVYRVYQRILEANGALDFDDLLVRVAQLLQHDAGFRERWQQRFDFLLIDEYQDTNAAQYRIAKALAAQHRNLCATGDADQAIYGWRGADIQNILAFQKDFPDAAVIKLEQNYRSTQTILRAADSLITKNQLRHERGLWTENEQGVPVAFHHALDARQEAAFVARSIAQREAEGRSWSDFAVFYRTNAQSRLLEEELPRARVPYRIVGAVEFYSRQEVKDVLAYLRVCVNERDGVSLLRIINTPSRGIGARTIGRLRAWADESAGSPWDAVADVEHVPELGARARKAVEAFGSTIDELRRLAAETSGGVAPFCQRLLVATGYQAWLDQPEQEERRENVQELLSRAAEYDEAQPEGDLAGFLQDVSLVSDVDDFDGTAEAATLMTLHTAKGLEFPVVFLTGLEDGLLPHANAMRPPAAVWGLEDPARVEEERRLCYVGMTRAQKELILTAAAERMTFNAPSEREPSRFLHEISRTVFDEDSLDALDEALDGAETVADTERLWPRRRRGGSRPASAHGRRGTVRQQAPAGPDELTIDYDEVDEPVAGEEAAIAPEPPAGADPGDFAVGDAVAVGRVGQGMIVDIKRAGRYTLATVKLHAGGRHVIALESARVRKL